MVKKEEVKMQGRCERMRVLMSLLVFAGTLAGKIWRVPEDYPYIQRAIDEASNGDTVSVRPGRIDNPAVYYENINFKGKNIIVSARNLDWTTPSDIDNPDPRATVIDGSNPSNPDSASVVYFVQGEGPGAELRGFTITGGSGTLVIESGYLFKRGGGIYIQNASPNLKRLSIELNSVGSDDTLGEGGGLYAEGGSLTLRKVLLLFNSALGDTYSSFSWGGGGITLINVISPILGEDTLRGNYSTSLGGAVYLDNTDAEFKRC